MSVVGSVASALALICLLSAAPAAAQSTANEKSTASEKSTAATKSGAPDLLGWLASLEKTSGGPATPTTAPTAPVNPTRRAATAPPVGQFRPRDVLVIVAGTANIEQAIAQDFALTTLSITPVRVLGQRIVRYRINDERSVATVLAALAQDPRVAAAQPNLTYQLRGGSSALPQYALDKIGAGAAHRLAHGKGVAIAVIDTGIDDRHPDLQGSVTLRFDAVGDGGSDTGKHGTAIAGLIAAHRLRPTLADPGLRGMAPDASIWAVRAFSSAAGADADSDTLILLRALDWCATNRASIVNMSLTGPDDPLLAAAIAGLIAQGSLVVAAAGNAGPEAPPAFPAALPGVLAVSASDVDDRIFAGANRGDYIAVTAPGVAVLTTGPDGTYSLETGTSFAAAIVSGAAALLVSAVPGLTAGELRALLMNTSRDLGPPGPDRDFGAGRLDIAAAVAATAGRTQALAVAAPQP